MAEFPNIPGSNCILGFIVRTTEGLQELTLEEFNDLLGGPSEVWNELVAARQTELIEIAPGIQATRITSYTMERPNGQTIQFNFGPI